MDETTIARWTYAIDRSVGPRPFALYRHTTTRTHHTVLPASPGEAQLRLLDLADAARSAHVRRLAS
jgi:hypothetical protein